MTIESLYEVYKQYPSVQTDTRKLKSGDLFFALKGDNFNGNHFAGQAIAAGAEYAVIDDAHAAIPGKTILVDDVLTTLQSLAKYHREQFKQQVPFLAITGSNGKTTTKELIHAVLSASYKTSTTEGNLNNHIGIPLTILKVKMDAEIVVIEMGANHQHEIEGYCVYTEPSHGLITNIGKAHLEGFGGPEGVKKGKGELFDYLRLRQGTAFVLTDDPNLQELSNGMSDVVQYGTVHGSTKGSVIKSEPFLEVAIEDFSAGNINTNLVGEYNLPNVLAAVAVGIYFKVPPEKIKEALGLYVPSNSRSQLIEKGSNRIILDAYNANPSSMKLAIENFAKLNAPNKVLLLGAMAELGAESVQEHKAIVELLQNHDWKSVVLVGGDFLKFDHPFTRFATAAEAGAWLQVQALENAYLLIKGSRSMKMEKVLQETAQE